MITTAGLELSHQGGAEAALGMTLGIFVTLSRAEATYIACGAWSSERYVCLTF